MNKLDTRAVFGVYVDDVRLRVFVFSGGQTGCERVEMIEGGGERVFEVVQEIGKREMLVWFYEKEAFLAVVGVEEGELEGCEVDGLFFVW